MNIESAIIVKKRCLAAIKELDSILRDSQAEYDTEEFDRLKRAVGLTIGKITIEILDPVLQQHTEIDDLR